MLPPDAPDSQKNSQWTSSHVTRSSSSSRDARHGRPHPFTFRIPFSSPLKAPLTQPIHSSRRVPDRSRLGSAGNGNDVRPRKVSGRRGKGEEERAVARKVGLTWCVRRRTRLAARRVKARGVEAPVGVVCSKPVIGVRVSRDVIGRKSSDVIGRKSRDFEDNVFVEIRDDSDIRSLHDDTQRVPSIPQQASSFSSSSISSSRPLLGSSPAQDGGSAGSQSACCQSETTPTTLQSQRQSVCDVIDSQTHPTLPNDPRTWSRDNVAAWLTRMRTAYNLPDLDIERFRMNGKALCIMTPDMFLFRVPTAGITLYLDFQQRLRRALYAQLEHRVL